MKPFAFVFRAFALVALIAAIFALPIIALAAADAPVQSAVPAVSAPEIPSAVDSVLQVVADALLGKFGWAAKLFATLGTIAAAARFFVKPFWAFVVPKLDAYVKSTPGTEDDERLHAFLGNPIVKGFLFVLDVLVSVKIPTPSK